MITYKCASFLHVTRISDMRCSVITCLLLLLPQLSYQSDGGPFCLDCVGNLDAQCSIHYDNETITCIANTTVCNHSRQCEEGEFCHFAFTLFPGGAWAFDAECFPDTREDECILEAADRTSFSFPPHQGTTCQCNNCTLDEPLVYVHPRHHVGVSITPSSVSPSPSPSSGGDSSLQGPPLVAVIIVCTILLILLLPVTAIATFWVIRRFLQAKREHDTPIPVGDGEGTGFHNLSAEEDLPFRLGHCIRRGRFGHVYRTQYENELVAVKIFSYQNRMSWENERSLFGMQSTKHRNIVDYVVSGSWGAGSQLRMFIVTPFYPLGSLNQFLARNTVSWEQACRVIHSVSSGLGHLHAESYSNTRDITVAKYAVAHRDVKSANVLVRGENGDCVLADLGFALILDPSMDEKDMANAGQVGTYRYMAPEVLDARVNLHNTQAFKQIDIYALSLVMWEVVWRCNVLQEVSPCDYMMAYKESVGERPGIDSVREAVCAQKLRPQILTSWRNHPGLAVLVGTIEECWDEDPEARLSAVNVVLRLKELLDGGPSALVSDHTPLHISTHTSVSNRFHRSDAQESTTDTIGTTDSRPPPYDNRWGYSGACIPANIDRTSSDSMGLNVDDTTV